MPKHAKTEQDTARKGRPACTMPVLLLAATCVVFLPSVRYGFTGFDDTALVLDNPLVHSLRPVNISRMFSRFSITSYYPVRLLSLAVDHAIWGVRPAGYHLTNTLLHTLNALLLYLLVLQCLCARRLLSPPAAPVAGHALLPAGLAAALFALHPVVVEPVVWVAGREELLTVLFALLTLRCHILSRTNTARRRPYAVLAALCCALGCLSNVLGAVIPALVLLCDLLVLRTPETGRARHVKAALIRGIPLWAAALAAVALKAYSHARIYDYSDFGEEMNMRVGTRVLTVLGGYWRNLADLFVPVRLSPINRNVVPDSMFQSDVLLGALLAIGTLGLLRYVRRRPVVLLGLLWFLAALAPSSQFISHHIFRANRFLYLPLAGLALAAGAALNGGAASPRGRPFCLLGCGAVLVALGVASVRQRALWRDTDAFFRYVLKRAPDSYLAHYSHGQALLEQGRLEEAAAAYRAAVGHKPDYANGHFMCGWTLARLKQYGPAEQHLAAALAIKPDYAAAHNELGLILATRGALAPAIAAFSNAVRTTPAYEDAHINLGKALGRTGHAAEAIMHLSTAVQINPGNARTHKLLGVALGRVGELPGAIRHLSQALRIRPDYAEAHRHLARTLELAGRRGEAANHAAAARRLPPAR